MDVAERELRNGEASCPGLGELVSAPYLLSMGTL